MFVTEVGACRASISIPELADLEDRLAKYRECRDGHDKMLPLAADDIERLMRCLREIREESLKVIGSAIGSISEEDRERILRTYRSQSERVSRILQS